MYNLTIAIPTYNRHRIICKNIEFLKKNLTINNIEIIISDNGSDDQSYELLQDITKDNTMFNIYKNRTNLGFAKNFLKLFNLAKGKYILVISDEDFINIDIIKEIISFLKRTNPNLVFSGTDKPNIRGCGKLKKINFDELHRSAYISGVIYNREIALKYITYLAQKIDENIFLQLYPQVILTELIYGNHGSNQSYIYPGYIVECIFQEKTYIRTGGKSYGLPEKRLEQYIYYERLLKLLKDDNIINDRVHSKLLLMEQYALRQRILTAIRNSDLKFKDVFGKNNLEYYKKVFLDFLYLIKLTVRNKLFDCSI